MLFSWFVKVRPVCVQVTRRDLLPVQCRIKKAIPKDGFLQMANQQSVQAADVSAALKVALGHMMALSFSGDG